MLLPSEFCSLCPPVPKARRGAGGGPSRGRRARPVFCRQASSVRRGVARWSDALQGTYVDSLSVQTLAGERGRPRAWTPGPGDHVQPSVRRPGRACLCDGRLRGLPWSSEAPASGPPTRGRISPLGGAQRVPGGGPTAGRRRAPVARCGRARRRAFNPRFAPVKPTTAGGRLEAPGGAGGQAPEAPPEAADQHVAARARQKALLTPY